MYPQHTFSFLFSFLLLRGEIRNHRVPTTICFVEKSEKKFLIPFLSRDIQSIAFSLYNKLNENYFGY